MTKILKLSFVTSMLIVGTMVMAEDVKQPVKSVKALEGKFAPIKEKDLTVVDKFNHMFTEGKVSGRIKSLYAGYDQKSKFSAAGNDDGNFGGENLQDTYATAIGGTLRYELAEFNGFNGAIAFSTSNDMRFATGSRNDTDTLGNPIQRKQNDELSSSDGSYTALSEAYINYNYEDLNIRLGRQVLETPLADSDDIRMIANTFEAYIATYSLNGIEIMAGNIQRWQGVDAGLDDGWVKAGENGTWFGGVAYEEDLMFNAWYYNITELTNAAYVDLGYSYQINKDIKLNGMVQYLSESELNQSGVKADIYGALIELEAYGFGLNIAIDESKKHTGKQSYSGTGGGTLFTSMDTMILDEIADDRKATAVVGGLVYEYNDLVFLYAYGDFKGKENSNNEKAHIIEQNIGFEYTYSDAFQIAAIYVDSKDKEAQDNNEAKNDWDYNRLQVMLAYNF